MNNRELKIVICMALFFLALHLAGAAQFSGSSYASTISSNPGISRPSFENYYSSSGGGFLGFDTFYPKIEGQDICVGRQDILLRIPTGGCQPAVVRSDLLAEQNVPVFCQIEAIKINPLVDITKIRRITFDSKKPQEVLDVGFHPSRVALNSREKLLGSPIDRNIGYVVVVLKRNEIEEKLPEFVNVNLTARIFYDTENTLGVGRAEFVLSPVSDEEWEREEKNKQSFWNGRYYLRLLEAESDYADIGIYQGDRLVTQTRIIQGRPSNDIFLPGSYCRAGLRADYAGFIKSENKARLELGDPGGSSDVFEVYEGSDFLNGRCVVRDIEVNDTLNTGSVTVDCGSKRVVLRLGLNFPQFEGKIPRFNNETNITSIALDNNFIYGVNFEGKLLKYNWEELDWEEIPGYVVGEDKFDEKVRNLDMIRSGLIAYHNTLFNSPNKIQKPDYEIGESVGAIDEAIEEYERIAEEYPDTRIANSTGFYGEQALEYAINLALDSSRSDEAARLISKLLNNYPDSKSRQKYQNELDKIALVNTENASDVIYLEGKYRTLRVRSLSKPEKISTATFAIGNNIEVIEEGTIGNLTLNGNQVGKFRVERVETNSALVTPICKVGSDNQGGFIFKEQGRISLSLNDERVISVCGTQIKLDKTNIEKVAMIRLNPITYGPESVANLSVNIGIEKRLIKLNPEKSLEKIERLNKTIAKWENIADNLGKVVKGLKGACFATAGVLTIKNFVTGLSGEGLARQKVMRGDNGWTTKCQQMVDRGSYSNLNDCYLGESTNINKDVAAYKDAINEVNNNIKTNEEVYQEEGFLGDKTVNRDTSVNNYRGHLLEKYGSEKVRVNGKDVSVSEILKNEKGYEDAEYSYEQLREMELNLILRKKGLDGVSNDSQQELQSIFERVQDNQILNEKLKQSSGINARAPVELKSDKQQNIDGNVISINRINDRLAKSLTEGPGNQNVKDAMFFHTSSLNTEGIRGAKPIDPGYYAAGVEIDSQGNYGIKSMVKVNESEDPQGAALSQNEINNFVSVFHVGKIISKSSTTYNNKYLNPKARYYDNEPYKGMPALVPFDVNRGWYVATRQTLPAFGGASVGAFESNGRVANFWLCNVGRNGKEQFNEGLGDDICEQFNTYSGQSYSFPGITDSREVRALIDRAKRALEEAANQYGNKQIVVNGFKINDVTAAANIPTVQCQDFMDPKDCYALFNVCDPVICPASRCNLGGNYQVADVIQSGIVGSTLLCLPNIKEKIAIPVCLSGIHAGIDSYVSILKSYRSCLQESVDSGRVVGICDQITSIYLCEFFWRQAAPAANVILPKLVDSIYRGKSARGGGEYLTVQGAWNNMQNSVNYFKNTYAVNSLKAFQIRSVEEVGTPFCKAFISAKAPTKFDNLIEPDSPPQFHAWFSSIKLNDAALHPFDQYKIFYHIFAGRDAGVSYRVYLKDPPQGSYISVPVEYTVAQGFISKGDYNTQTLDLAAPSGYKELCVSINGEENCGFKQVSSSFAVNYVRDKYVQGEIERTDIGSERECVSGGVNPAAILANTNPQFALEESILPEDYKRGIVRICATNNPGISTDPTRFQDVGYCDDPQIRCWLDKKSVDKAITAGNELVRNETLSELEERQISILQGKGEVLSEDQINAKIFEFSEELKSVSKRFESKDNAPTEGEVRTLLGNIEDIIIKTYLNKQKAELLLIKARVLDVFARGKLKSEKANIQGGVPPSDVAPKNNVVTPPINENAEPISTIPVFTIEGTEEGYKIDEGIKMNIKYDSKLTGIYITANKIYNSTDDLIGIVRLLADGRYRLSILPDKKDQISEFNYNELNLAFIETSTENTAGRELKIVK
ncbi:MAG: hypothetical protein Q8Q31_01060 [Nanoarchaeota archaeon]|nr:hypothetical protein [Nanoarchaeota archaeon]